MKRNVSRAGQVMGLLIKTPGATRPQLCRQAGMSPAAMQQVVDQLKAAQAICQDGFDRSSGGRRAARYRVNPGVGQVAGVSLSADGVKAALYGCDLKELAQAHIPFALAGSGPEAGLMAIAQGVEQLMPQEAHGPMLGVGVAVEGPVKAGVVGHMLDAPLWQGFDLAGRLAKALNRKVVAGRGLWMELETFGARGQVKKPECAALLRVADQVEAALMVEGRVVEGGHGHAGALGHLPMRRDGIPCACGGAGCLALYCAQEGMVRQYAAQTGRPCASTLELLDRMDRGDQAAVRTVGQAMNYLVEALSTLALCYDPLEILVDCAYLTRRKPLFFKLLDAFYARSTFTRAGMIDVRLAEPPPMTLVAASCALGQLLSADARWA